MIKNNNRMSSSTESSLAKAVRLSGGTEEISLGEEDCRDVLTDCWNSSELEDD